MIYVQTYQEILVLSRRHHDIDEFYQELQRNSIMMRKGRDRVTQLLQYCQKISMIDDDKKEMKAAQADQDNQLRGASIMNAVLSGNIFNSFNNYATNSQQDLEPEAPTQIGSQMSATEGGGSPFKSDFGIQPGDGSPDSQQISAMMNL